MLILDLILGTLLLFAGRNLFWLCVGTVGFLIGFQCSELVGISNGWSAFVTAFAFGCVGLVLAMCFEWCSVIIGAGFLGGGYLLMNMVPATVGQGAFAWPVFVVGGIIGMCLMVIAFNWTLIMISSLLGAILISHAIHGSVQIRDIVFISCFLSGLLVQGLSNVLRTRPAY